jgi:DNA-binding NarL/FixJ family response regulator
MNDEMRAGGGPGGSQAAVLGRRSTSVMVVDAHAAVRRGTELLLSDAGFSVLSGTGDVEQARAAIRDSAPAVVILDLRLGGRSGLHLCEILAREHPSLGILIYTGVGDSTALRQALAAPALGVLLKAASPEELVVAIEHVARGSRYVDVNLRSVEGRPAEGRLSSREREVLQLIANGMSGEAIADVLFLSGDTVRTHVRNAVAKLGASSRAHAIAIALRTGEIGYES